MLKVHHKLLKFHALILSFRNYDALILSFRNVRMQAGSACVEISPLRQLLRLLLFDISDYGKSKFYLKLA